MHQSTRNRSRACIKGLLILGVLVAAIAAMAGMGHMGPQGDVIPGGVFALGLLILVGGGLDTILLGGLLYLGLGIYQNTRRTAEALERMAGRG